MHVCPRPAPCSHGQPDPGPAAGRKASAGPGLQMPIPGIRGEESPALLGPGLTIALQGLPGSGHLLDLLPEGFSLRAGAAHPPFSPQGGQRRLGPGAPARASLPVLPLGSWCDREHTAGLRGRWGADTRGFSGQECPPPPALHPGLERPPSSWPAAVERHFLP